MAESTSLQRTYRYLRVGVVATVVVIAVAVIVASGRVGWLPSISAYYYTPARNAVVGALVAVSLALLALSGRGVARALLDAAGLLAPLIALVPTPVTAGEVPGVPGCAPRACVPPESQADVDVAVVVYLVVVTAALLFGLALALLRQVDVRAVLASLAVGGVVVLVVLASWGLAREAFLTDAHFLAATLFFLLIGAVAVLNAVPGVGGRLPSVRFRVLYLVVAAGMVLDVIAATVVLVTRPPATPVPWVLVCEAAALGFFLLFWVLQTVEKWDDRDPALALAPA